MPTLTPEEHAGTLLANNKLALAITPYFFNLIDPADENCPIRRQVIPRVEETHTAPWEMSDPCGEDSHSPVPGLVHRYPDRVSVPGDRPLRRLLPLLHPLPPGQQRHRLRFPSRISTGRSNTSAHTPAIRDVLLSGGDPLLFSDEKLENFLATPARDSARRISAHRHAHSDFSAAAHHARILRHAQEISSAVHQHPFQPSAGIDHGGARALGPAGRRRAFRWATNPSCLRHVNDERGVMRAQVQKLLMCRVKPYYLYQCDLISGSAHLRASVREGVGDHGEFARPHHGLRRAAICD